MTEPLETPSPETNEAVRGLAIVWATVLGLVGLTYLVPAWSSFRPLVWGAREDTSETGDVGRRPYRTGENWLVVRHYFDTAGDDQAIATGGAHATAAVRDVDALSGQLGRGVAGALVDGADTPHAGPRTRIDASEYAGLEQHLVDASGDGMRPFYEALLRTAREEPHAITRAGHYGDSSIATDRITSTIRRHFQLRFGDSGHGFVLISKSYMPYAHLGLDHEASDGWNAQEVTRRSRNDGRYGYGGIVLRGGGGARAAFGNDDEGPIGRKVSRFELWYSTHPRFGQVELTIDGGEPRIVSTAAPVGEGVERIELPDGEHRMRVRALSLVELYGVVLERDVPGVVWDSLGLVGARANRLLNFDAAHVRSQIERRDLDLLVLGFGGNEASDTIDPELYEADFERVVERMRGGRRDLGCLILAPLDQAGRQPGLGLRTFRGLPHIVEAQRRVAARAGCAFFDTFAAMGGSGSMIRWFRANPPLASGDYRHATPEGYEVIGTLVYRAILEGFARYLEQQRPDAGR